MQSGCRGHQSRVAFLDLLMKARGNIEERTHPRTLTPTLALALTLTLPNPSPSPSPSPSPNLTRSARPRRPMRRRSPSKSLRENWARASTTDPTELQAFALNA